MTTAEILCVVLRDGAGGVARLLEAYADDEIALAYAIGEELEHELASWLARLEAAQR
jgi:hypothetical protein